MNGEITLNFLEFFGASEASVEVSELHISEKKNGSWILATMVMEILFLLAELAEANKKRL